MVAFFFFFFAHAYPVVFVLICFRTDLFLCVCVDECSKLVVGRTWQVAFLSTVERSFFPTAHVRHACRFRGAVFFRYLARRADVIHYAAVPVAPLLMS